jgi:hypothetical protein
MIEGAYGEGGMQIYSNSIIIILPNQWNILQGYFNGKGKRFKQGNKIVFLTDRFWFVHVRQKF